MNADGKSDESVVPPTSMNKDAAEASTESNEGRLSAVRNIDPSNLDRTLSRNNRRSHGLLGVRMAARQSRDLKFTALLHHVDAELLMLSFQQLNKRAAPGVDPTTWHGYEEDLENRIVDLHGRIHRGAYRALPSRRVHVGERFAWGQTRFSVFTDNLALGDRYRREMEHASDATICKTFTGRK